MNVLVGVTFLLMGLLVHRLKWYGLIAGFNTMRPERQNEVDIVSVARTIGYYGYANAAVFILSGVLLTDRFSWGGLFPYLFLVLSTLGLLIRLQRFDKQVIDGEGRFKAGAKRRLALKLLPVVLVLVGVGGLMVYSSRPPRVSTDEVGIAIEGMYGESFTWEEIRSLTLLEDLPDIQMKTNGSALGPHLKGHFRVSDHGGVLLHVDTRTPPYILIQTEEEKVIFNLPSSIDTMDLYRELDDSIDSDR